MIDSRASRRIAVVSCLLVFGSWAALAAYTADESSDKTKVGSKSTSDAKIDFSRQVRSILSDRCFKCHGPDEEAREGDLRLDVRKAALEALSPNAPTDSELLSRITSTDEDERMPPPDSNLSLKPEEIEILRRWISQGAPYDQHWSFIAPRPVTPPQVQLKEWPKNEIDRFILRRLEQEKLSPSPQATKEKLIRRLTFDLTGLPPTLAEIDQFLADESPQAYEKLVDRLLASKHYGQRMASVWLDVARYSDSYGYQVDRDRFVWPWRDWVVEAFNENMPYDQFVTWQLAGDLLPGATDKQILATTFNRLHPQKVEGGSTPEEFRVEYVADRLHTFGTAFLGLSLECARCHDHKYDPLAQKEYYQLFSYFADIDEAGLYSYFTSSVPTPTMRMTDEAKKTQITDIERRMVDEQKKLAKIASGNGDAFNAWLANRPAEASIPGRVGYLDFENHKSGANASIPGKVGNAVRLSGDDGIGVGVGNFSRNQPFSVALWLNTPDVKERAVVFHRSRAWTDAGSRGYQLLIEEGRLSASLIHFWPGNAIRVRTREPIAPGQWHHVAIVYDGSSRAAGLKIMLGGKPADCEIVRDNLYKNITGGGGNNITIGQRFRDRGFKNGLVDEFQVFDRAITPIEVTQLFDAKSLDALLMTPVDKLSDEQRVALRSYYLATADEAYSKQLAALRSVREQRSKTVDSLREIMVMRQKATPRQSYLLKRGAYDARGEKVESKPPAVFPPPAKDAPRNRLGLARWLTDPGHPLTSRVAVNRLWQMTFGTGLVHTPEDFGSQGAAPTHPELLDWLAIDFAKHNWDVKRMLKLMVLSATYRQTSVASKTLRERDPENELLGRAPRYRLSAEMIRDNALAGSGLLVDKIGGAPVRPYDLAVSFKPINPDSGDGLYRRSLYTYWKRTAPAPVMMAFNSSKRDVCSVKRERTSSPLQALVLLNGPQFVEAARVLAQNSLKKHGEDTPAALAEIFRTLTGRQPAAAELKILSELYDQQLTHFENAPENAQKLLKTGSKPADATIAAPRLAAVAVVTSTLMAYDESIMKR